MRKVSPCAVLAGTASAAGVWACAWARRRALLVQLPADAEPGIRLNEHIEDVAGAVVFRQACVMGLEGIVAKRRDRPYRSGRSADWIKIENPDAPAAAKLTEG